MNLALLLASGIGVYGSFFAQPAPKPNVNPPIVWNQAPRATPPRPAVVCGMMLLPADPKTDPSMKRRAPDPKRFPMQTFAPQICRR